MRLRLSSRGVPLDAMGRQEIERIVRQTLSRHGSRVGALAISLLPSPRIHGGGCVWCRIRVLQCDGRGWIAEDHAGSARDAVFGASARVERQLDRERSLLRSERGPLAPLR